MVSHGPATQNRVIWHKSPARQNPTRKAVLPARWAPSRRFLSVLQTPGADLSEPQSLNG